MIAHMKKYHGEYYHGVMGHVLLPLYIWRWYFYHGVTMVNFLYHGRMGHVFLPWYVWDWYFYHGKYYT